MQFIDLKAQQEAIKPDLDERIARVLSHGQYVMGPEVAELEAALAAYVGTQHCLTVASGTEALLIALMALGIGPGDEVITTPFTFVATAEMIVLTGATPVFVDIDPETANICAAAIEPWITDKTKAIIPVSLYGQVVDMDEINAVARKYGGIAVIEDAAQSFGARYKGRPSCGLSTLGCTSFFPSKPLGCYGDGGALFTNDDALAQAAREIRVHGQKKRYVHNRIGVGGRMDTLQCAIVLAKWPRFPWEIEQRGNIGAAYTSGILSQVTGAAEITPAEARTALGGVRTLKLRPDRTSVYAQYSILVPNRDVVQSRLKAAGIPTAVHYPVPLNEQPAYRHLAQGPSTPISSWFANHVMSLPMGPDLSQSDQQIILDAMAAI